MKPTVKQPAPRDNTRDLEAMRDIADDVIESDFVPFACLYDPSTIATKNGELLQTIKITGLGFETSQQADLRGSIRAAIRAAIPDTSYGIWLHTLRRKQQLLPHAHFPDAFSGNLDASWRAQHPSSASFVNELYVTVVKAAQPAGLKNFSSMLKSLLPKRDTAGRSEYLDLSLQELSGVTGKMISSLQQYGARLLTVVERQGVYYHEQLEFLEKLINLEERPIELPRRDLSYVLTSGEITFAHNAMEVRTAEGKRRFAAILTIKEYKESTLRGIDKFLEIPCEVIVTQCFDFIHADAAREDYEKQARYLSISGDKELAQWMEIDRLMQPGAFDDGMAFGQQQTTLFLISPTVKQLETNIRMVIKALGKLGILGVREDIRFEECYWAQLPGNFQFTSRQHSIDTPHLAGFANLQTQPMGNAAGSAWGAPVSLFTTLQDQPYFFNFHRGDSGHTLLIGRQHAGTTTLLHFLLAQARKLNPAIWYLDGTGRGELFMNAIGGRMLQPGTPALRLNPLQLPDTATNRDFLAFWLSTLVDPEARQLNQSTLGFFQSLVGEVMKLPMQQRRLTALLPIIRDADPMLAREFQRWCAGGPNGELFDMPEDNFATADLIGWNLAPYMQDATIRAPLTAYLLHRITGAANGRPTLLVMSDGLLQLSTPLFAARANGWWQHLATRNTLCLMTSADSARDALLPFANTLAQRAANIFLLPDADPAGDLAMGFQLDGTDLATIAHLDRGKHHVFLKRGAESTVIKLDLSPLGSSLATLSGRRPQPQKSPADQLHELMGYGAPA